MIDFNELLQTLLDNETKPNSILCFCRDLYEYKKARYEYCNIPSRVVHRGGYYYKKYEALVKDWLSTFHLEDTYTPEDFFEDFK